MTETIYIKLKYAQGNSMSDTHQRQGFVQVPSGSEPPKVIQDKVRNLLFEFTHAPELAKGEIRIWCYEEIYAPATMVIERVKGRSIQPLHFAL